MRPDGSAPDPAVARGFAVPRFEAVLRTLEENVRDRDEHGCSVCVYLDGEVVVDAWSGRAGDGLWKRDTTAIAYSCGKGVTAFCANLLHSRGLLDIDAPVGRYWPEYACNGKENTLVRHFLNHTSGSITFPNYGEILGADQRGLLDWDLMVEALAAAPAGWPPGTRAGYHTITFGHLVGELLRRVDGRHIRDFMREEIGIPYSVEYHLGVPESELSKVSPLLPAPVKSAEEMSAVERTAADSAARATEAARQAFERGEIFSQDAWAWSTGFHIPGAERGYEENSAEYLRASLPGFNGVGNARGLARLHAILAMDGVFEGTDVMSKDSIDVFAAHSSDPPNTPPYGLGYNRLHAWFGPSGMSEGAIGHIGAGGNIGFADRERRLGMGYVKNRTLPEPSALISIISTVYDCL